MCGFTYRPPASGAAVQLVGLASLRAVLRRRHWPADSRRAVAALSVNEPGVFYLGLVTLRGSGAEPFLPR